MRRVLLIAAALLVASTAVAQTSNPYQLKGFTAATLQGNAGVFGFATACQAEFGAAARMCTSAEVLQTVVIPAGLSGNAWVRPIGQASGSGALMDASGFAASPASLACGTWSDSSSGYYGLTVNAVGQFVNSTCSTARPVACCAPVPLPEPSAMLLNGAGFAALTLLSVAKG